MISSPKRIKGWLVNVTPHPCDIMGTTYAWGLGLRKSQVVSKWYMYTCNATIWVNTTVITWSRYGLSDHHLCMARDCLTRQVREAVLIRRSQVQVLNSKSEWHQPALFRVQQEIERGWIMGCPSMKSTGANWSRKFFHLSFWYWIMNNQLICNLEYCQKWSGRKPKLVFDNANKLFHVTFAYEDRKQFDAHKS